MDKKLKLKTELAKKLKKETSVTGTGASVTPGTGEGVATKYAFGKRDNKGTPSDWKPAPSVPNRSSKVMDYKELWEEAGTDEVVAILNNPNLDPDVKKTLMSAYRQGHITADGVLAIVNLVLKKGSLQEAKLDIDDRIKVTYGNEFYGETGTITDIKRGFVTVEMDKDGNEYSMHSSDVQKIEDEDDDEDMINEGYAQFRNETKMRSKPDQFHQAVKQVKKKMNEINRIFEYVDRLKSELSEGEDLKYKKYTENAFQQIKESAKALFLKSTKLK